jgi:hypothetical protein
MTKWDDQIAEGRIRLSKIDVRIFGKLKGGQ